MPHRVSWAQGVLLSSFRTGQPCRPLELAAGRKVPLTTVMADVTPPKPLISIPNPLNVKPYGADQSPKKAPKRGPNFRDFRGPEGL